MLRRALLSIHIFTAVLLRTLDFSTWRLLSFFDKAMRNYYCLPVKKEEQRPVRIASQYRTKFEDSISQWFSVWLTQFRTELAKKL